MRGGVTVTASPQSYSVLSPPSSWIIQQQQHTSSVTVTIPRTLGSHKLPKFSFRCNSTGNNSGDNESRTILDAFFLGKAVAEAVNERVESAVGEFLSTIGRLQAEQQKQVQEFQEDVLEKARRAKEQAAREAMEAQGLVITKSTVADISTVNGFEVTSASESATIIGSDEDPLSEIPIDD